MAQRYFSVDRVAGWLASRVLEELELKPIQPSTAIGLGFGVGLSLAKILRLYTNDVLNHCVDANVLNVFKQT